MSNQNCIDWLVDRFLKSGNNLFVSDVEKAKEMHKQELENAFNESRLTHHMIGFKHKSFDDYYTETFETTQNLD